MNANLILGGKKPGRGSLWQGSVHDAAKAKDYSFDCLVMTAMEFQPSKTDIEALVPVHVIAHPFDDCELTSAHLRKSIEIGNLVARRVKDGQHVLVTCAMGLNRSGLIVALAAHQLTGLDGDQIVRRIQMKRSGALSNRSFARAIRSIRPAIRLPHSLDLEAYISVPA